LNRFRKLFPNGKPILGMLHLKGDTKGEVVEKALVEAKIMDYCGIHSLIVENYFGEIGDVLRVLDELPGLKLKCKTGINILGNPEIAFSLARRYPIDFIQIDSVAGHLTPGDDVKFAQMLSDGRDSTEAAILGGVRFKYMPVRSDNTEYEDLQIGEGRCDAIVVSSDGTGQETSISKIDRFRKSLASDTPLIVGAGLTAYNVRNQLDIADGGIVGSWLKDNHRDDGDIDTQNVQRFLSAISDS